jgi:hypothetical protein
MGWGLQCAYHPEELIKRPCLKKNDLSLGDGICFNLHPMNTRTFYLLFLIVWVSAAAAWSQGVPPPPTPVVGPSLSSPSDMPLGTGAPVAPSQPVPPPSNPYSPGGYYTPTPGTVIVPGNPYGPPSPYPPGAVIVSPRVAVLEPAPPLPSYEWGVAVDALFLERSSGGSIPLGSTVYNLAVPPGPTPVGTDNLFSDDESFPLAAGLRVEVSRKFDNDITLAATYWGLQQWSVGRTIYGDPAGETVLALSPWLQLSKLLTGLDNSLGYTYGSQIQNVEFNTFLRLNPADPYWEVDWLWGARYIYLADNLTLAGSDAANSASERLSSNTTNNLIGAQTGLYFVHGWSRFQWESGLKFGLMANIYHQHETDSSSYPPVMGFKPLDNSASGGDLAALFEVSVRSRSASAIASRTTLGSAWGTNSTTSPGWPWPRGSLPISAMAAIWPSTGSRSACRETGDSPVKPGYLGKVCGLRQPIQPIQSVNLRFPFAEGDSRHSL